MREATGQFPGLGARMDREADQEATRNTRGTGASMGDRIAVPACEPGGAAAVPVNSGRAACPRLRICPQCGLSPTVAPLAFRKRFCGLYGQKKAGHASLKRHRKEEHGSTDFADAQRRILQPSFVCEGCGHAVFGSKEPLHCPHCIGSRFADLRPAILSDGLAGAEGMLGALRHIQNTAEELGLIMERKRGRHWRRFVGLMHTVGTLAEESMGLLLENAV